MASTDDYPNLDFLRSCAVLFVCGSHLLQFFAVSYAWGNRLSMERLGLWGVVIFFVHTCLVLMLSLERQQERGGLFPVFMIRRCFRIYPLSILAVTVVAAFHLPLAVVNKGGFSAGSVSPTHWTIFCNLTLIQNLANRGSLLGPLWSLPYEIQMYVLLPAIFLLTMSPRPLARIALLWTFAFVVGAVTLRHPVVNEKFLLCIPCFLPGVIAYRLLKRDRLQVPAFLWPLAIAALTIFGMFEGTHHWVKYWIGALLLGLMIPLFSQFTSRWINVPSQIIARYSYGIYLSHFFSIWLAFERLAALSMPVRLAVFIVSFVGLPVVLYHFVEEPGIRIGKVVADHVRTARLKHYSQATPIEA